MMEQETEMERGKRNRDEEEQQGAVVAPPPPPAAAVAVTPPNQRMVKDEPVDVDQQQPPTIKREDEAMDRAEVQDILQDHHHHHAQEKLLLVQEKESLERQVDTLKAEKALADWKVLQAELKMRRAEIELRRDKSEWRGVNKTRNELLIAHRLFGYAVTEAEKQSNESRLTLNPWLLKIVETERWRIDQNFAWMSTQAHFETGCYWHKISYARNRTCFGVEQLFRNGIDKDTELSDEPSNGTFSVMVLSHCKSKVEANTLGEFLVVGALSATSSRYGFGSLGLKDPPSVESLQLSQSCAKCPGFKKLWPGKQFRDSGLHYIEGGKTVRYSEEIQAKVRREAKNYSLIYVTVGGAYRTLDLNQMVEKDQQDPPNVMRDVTWIIYDKDELFQ